MDMQVLETRCTPSGGYKVDANRGERIGCVSSEWFSRPEGAQPDPDDGNPADPRRGEPAYPGDASDGRAHDF